MTSTSIRNISFKLNITYRVLIYFSILDWDYYPYKIYFYNRRIYNIIIYIFQFLWLMIIVIS